ncbi:MAG: hypothetical protein CMJ18_25260 [Phycisphaeraceae bacterium]|nr:hypothetical protein [Phycisphaeraceae bacterium]
MKHVPLILVAFVAGLGAVLDPALAADWPRWRGPAGTGYAEGCNPPMTWGPDENVRWKVEIPGHGHASPIVLGDRVYVLTAVGDAEAAPVKRGGRRRRMPKPSAPFEFRVMALGRRDGRVQWDTLVRKEVPHESTHRTASFASSTPVTDGEHVFAFFGSRGLYCLGMDGRVVWEKDLGDMRTRKSFGEGGSPALHGDTLIVPWDHEGDSFIVALDKRTGEQRWRVDRSERTSWTSPIVTVVRDRTQVVLAGTDASVGYDLATGDEIWRCSGMTMNVVPTPVIGHGLIYLMSGFRGAALQAVKLDEARGDVTGGAAIAWTARRGTPYVPLPLLSDGRLYFLKGNDGIISCVDAVTGAAHYSTARLPDVGMVYASPVGADGRVYVCGREGRVIVLEDGPQFRVLATNTLGEGIDATPALVDGEIFIRGSRHLFCIARTP